MPTSECNSDIAALVADDFSARYSSMPTPFLLHTAWGAIEAGEDFGLLGFCNADAGVGHVHAGKQSYSCTPTQMLPDSVYLMALFTRFPSASAVHFPSKSAAAAVGRTVRVKPFSSALRVYWAAISSSNGWSGCGCGERVRMPFSKRESLTSESMRKRSFSLCWRMASTLERICGGSSSSDNSSLYSIRLAMGVFGLVGDVGNHLLNLVLFDRQFCAERVQEEVIGKLGFQRRKAAFIKVAFGVASFQCGIEHLFDGVHRFFGAAAVDEDNQQSKQNHTDRQQKQELMSILFPPAVADAVDGLDKIVCA